MGYSLQPRVLSLQELKQKWRYLGLLQKSKIASIFPSENDKKAEALLACFCYAGCSTLLTLANKAIFSESKLNFPWMLLGVQSIIVTLLLLLHFSIRSDDRIVKKDLLRQMLMPCMLLTLFIYTNARAFRYISLPILTVIKSLAPMGIAIMERILFKEKVSHATYVAMILILSGNAVTVSHDIEFHAVGYAWAAFNVIMNIAYVLSLRYCLSNTFSIGQKTLHSNIIACSLMLPMAFLSGEYPQFFSELVKTSLRFRLLFLLSCALATGIGASVFWVMRTASGSTLSFVGAANKVFVVILGAILFDAKISGPGWVGVGIGTLASFVFAFAKAKETNKSARREESKEPMPEPDSETTVSLLKSSSQRSQEI